MKKLLLSSALLLGFGFSATSAMAQSYPGEARFREIFKELIETNTTYSSGNCTVAAQKMVDRLHSVGFSDKDAFVFTNPDFPKEGGAIAVIKGTSKAKKGVLLMAHLDVVEAKREDWTRDPFTLYEENGFFYGRGVSDMKNIAAYWVDNMMRYKEEGFKPKYDIKLALTCGEETTGAFNGAEWLSKNHKDWIDADFALNEGAGGSLDENGNRISLSVQGAQKVYQDFTITTTNPGGHSSVPKPENAIYDMADAMKAVQKLEFPVMFNDANREYFTRMAKIKGGEVGAAMEAIVKNPNDKAADALISKDNAWHSMLRTTCVATMINGGHALNALPQSVHTNVNCRIFPGVSVDSVQADLVKAINNPNVNVAIVEPRSIATPTPKMGKEFLEPIEKLADKYWKGVPVIPVLSTGATDGIYTSAAGIPTYGFSATFSEASGNYAHGLNERMRVRSLMEARQFQYELVKYYATH